MNEIVLSLPQATAILQDSATNAGGNTAIPFFLFFILIVIIPFALFLIFQILTAKNKKSYLGLIGVAIYFTISVIILLIYSSNPLSTLVQGLALFLFFNIPTVILLIVTFITNNKHKDTNRELNKSNINDL